MLFNQLIILMFVIYVLSLLNSRNC